MTEPQAATRLILVRHGQTAWNDASRFQGHLDSPLTERGIAQARGLAARLRRFQINAIYSSDLGRARHTAELIAEKSGHTVITDQRLRERALGIFEGFDREYIKAKHPAEWQQYESRDADFVVPNGESARGRFLIGLACLTELAQRHRNQLFVAVTHGGLVGGMFRHVTGLPLESPRRFSIQNAAYNSLTLEPDGTWLIETWGDTSHFDATG